jgi:prophage DNA circulation protein
MPRAPWREGLGPASFRGAFFHVEAGGKASGRRVALHEYPKRNLPYAEDMGRRAKRFRISGYLIGPNFTRPRDLLVSALEADGPGLLVLPKISALQVVCEGYTLTEVRERGGFCTVEMQFVEAGVPGFTILGVDTAGVSLDTSNAATLAITQVLGGALKQQEWY